MVVVALLMIFGVHMSIISIVKVKILVFVEWSCGSLHDLLNVEPRTLIII